MRILAIRGENLASLAGGFSVHLEEGPLKGAGLFAITGPTGAGKSTLLDAMCLALFDETPRTSSARSTYTVVRPGGDPGDCLANSDVRALVRNGATTAFAEVDFVGTDGHTYRARWQVKRARSRAAGRLGKQEMSLVNLETNQSIGHRKTEVLAEIATRLGLTFHQFTRSVLLAQGDFAAFLKAKADERADLLERMTGTEIYGRISRAAFDRAKVERLQIESLHQQAASTQVLTAEERTALEEAANVQDAALRQARVTHDALKAAESWYATLRRLLAEEGTARESCSQVEQAWAEAGPRRDEVGAITAALPLQGLLHAYDAAEEAATRTKKDCASAEDAYVAACTQEVITKDALTAAEAALAGVVQNAEMLQPQLREAARLDTKIEEAKATERQAHVRAQEATQRAMAQAQAAEESAQKIRSLKAGLAAQDAWLADHPGLEPLATQWGRWQQEIQRYTAAATALTKHHYARSRLLGEQAPLVALVSDARTSEAAVALDLQEAAQSVAAAEAAYRGVPVVHLREEQERLAAERDLLATLQGLAEKASLLRREQDAAIADAAAACAEAEKAAQEEADSAARIITTQVALAEAERAYQRSLAVNDLAAHRSELQPGEPCALCGSTHHPWAEGAGPIKTLLADHKERVQALTSENLAHQKQQAGAAARQQAAGARARVAEARAQEHAAALLAMEATWREESAAVNALPPALFSPDTLPALQALAETLHNRVETVRAALADADGKRDHWEKLREGYDSLKRQLDKARAHTHELEQALLTLERRIQDETKEEAHAQQSLTSARTQLIIAFAAWSGWETDLCADAAAFETRWQSQAQEWRTRTSNRQAITERLTKERVVHEGAVTAAAERRAEAEAQAKDYDSATGALQSLMTARASTLDGRLLNEVETELAQRLETARANHETARASHSASASDTQTKAQLHQEAIVRSKQAEATAKIAKARLETAATEAGTDLINLRLRLAKPPGWITEEREALAALDQSLAEARTREGERRRAREAHEATASPQWPEPDLTVLLHQNHGALTTAEATLNATRGRLSVDDDARKRSRDIQERIIAQEKQAETWEILADLIGSHDGKKFRIFAQSLTLQTLLAHANHHLRDLARRYELIPVPGHDLDIQILDHDMGNEVRSVNSLSGGEGFLVSLALALGLASLTTRDTRTACLFIDEGFGALDPVTLEIALAALDSLQASGRRVGLISHVPGLAERIGAQVRVLPQGGGRSAIEVRGPSTT